MTEELNNDVRKLRFLDEDGQTYPNWEEKQLVEVAKIIGGGTPKTKEETYWGGAITWITPADMGKKYLTASAKTVTEEGIQNSSAKILPSNTVICSTRGTVGKFAIPGSNTAISQSCEAINLFSSIHNEFFYYQENNLKSFLNKVSAGSTFKAINKDTLSKFVFSLPSLPEQTKIADFLSNLDERIETQSKLVELLKKQKQGYSQKLFNGSLRFKKDDGTDYEDWEEKKFSNIFIDSNKRNDKNYPQYTVGKNGLKLKEDQNYEINNHKMFKPNDLLLGLGIEEATVSVSTYGSCSPVYSVFSFDCNEIAPYMLKEYIKFWLNKKKHFVSKTSTRREFEIVKSDLKKQSISIPSLPEQEKIADFLSSLDNRIDEQLNKLEQLKQEKQAYMQRVLG